MTSREYPGLDSRFEQSAIERAEERGLSVPVYLIRQCDRSLEMLDEVVEHHADELSEADVVALRSDIVEVRERLEEAERVLSS